MNPIGPILALALASGAAQRGNPVELGAVRWGRDLERAKAESARTGRPVLALFQEIPGCGTCVSFGQGPLSHPLLVEAIESELVPVAIYNNRPGRDAEVLAACREPAWNNPVMRFFDDRGRDLLPRRDGIYGVHGVAARLLEALRAARRPVPAYLALAAEESAPAKLETATLAMHCFWEGEARLGGIEGVCSTRAAYLGGHEVVELEFDPNRLGYAELVRRARDMDCASRVFARSDAQLAAARRVVGDRAEQTDETPSRAPDRDQLYHLRRSHLRYLPLTPLQAIRVNAALGTGGDPEAWLAPSQRALARDVAAALRRSPDLLAGMEAPRDAAANAAYESRLRARLSAGR